MCCRTSTGRRPSPSPTSPTPWSRHGGDHQMTDARLVTEQHGRVLIVTFTNPPRNFFNLQTATELGALVREIDKDSSIGAVILTGKDRFVTHFNVPDLLDAARSAPFPVSYRQAR